MEGQGWKNAGELVVGDLLRTQSGCSEVVKGCLVEKLDNPVRVWNLEIEDCHVYYVGSAGVLVHNECVENSGKPDATTGKGYDAGDMPVRIEGEWSINDLKQGLLGHPPRGLGSPDIHHGGQMPGAAKHEIVRSQHRYNKALHPNHYNQGVTIPMC